MAQRSTNTYEEGLTKMLSDIAQLKVMPDANLDFVVQLETMLINEIRAPQDAMAQTQADRAGFSGPGVGGLPASQQPPPMPPELMGAMAGAGGPPEMAGPPMPPMNPGGGGLRQNPGMPNPDELRRLIGQP